MTPDDQSPVLKIVRGNPSADEIAALVTVLTAVSRPAPVAGPAETVPAETVRSEWGAKSRMMRAPLRRGPGAWRASALPR